MLAFRDDASTDIATLAVFRCADAPGSAGNPTPPKVSSTQSRGYLYFSRSDFTMACQKEEWLSRHTYQLHWPSTLSAKVRHAAWVVVALRSLAPEKARVAEQLRWLENG